MLFFPIQFADLNVNNCLWDDFPSLEQLAEKNSSAMNTAEKIGTRAIIGGNTFQVLNRCKWITILERNEKSSIDEKFRSRKVARCRIRVECKSDMDEYR